MAGLILPWCFVVIRQYDEGIVDKKEKLQKKKIELTHTYHLLIIDLSTYLEKVLAVNSSMSETLFRGKFQVFRRWLTHVKENFPKIFEGNSEEYEGMVNHFKIYCVRWFNALQECSIDPWEHPWQCPTSAEDFKNCKTVVQVADYCLNVLDNAPKVDADIQRRRADGKKIMLENAEVLAVRQAEENPNWDLERDLKRLEKEQRAAMARDRCWPKWIQCCSGECACFKSKGTEDGWPKTFGCIIISLNVLSFDQIKLFIGFFIGLAVAALHLVVFSFVPAEDDTTAAFCSSLLEVATAVFLVALFWLLVCFEDIDLCEQLQRETGQLEKNADFIKNRAESSKQFWNSLKDMNEIWLYRTVPRLDLLEFVSHKLEDSAPNDIRNWIPVLNERLQLLEKNLGPVDGWRGTKMEGGKKQLRQRIKQVQSQPTMPKMLEALRALNNDDGGYFQSLPPAVDRRGSIKDSVAEAGRKASILNLVRRDTANRTSRRQSTDSVTHDPKDDVTTRRRNSIELVTTSVTRSN